MLQSEDQSFKNGLPKPIFSHGVTQGVTQSSRGSPRKAKESKRYADYDFEDFKVILIENNRVICANFKCNFNKGKYLGISFWRMLLFSDSNLGIG